MAENVTLFKGFQVVNGTVANFNVATACTDKQVLYFVRTDANKEDGYLYFNNKKYGTGNDVKTALEAFIGELPADTTATTVVDYVKSLFDQLSKGIDGLDADVSGASEHVSVQVVEEDGIITSVVVNEDDIASAEELSDLDDYIKGEIQTEGAVVKGGIEKRVEALEQINAEADFESSIDQKDDKEFVEVKVAESTDGKLDDENSSVAVTYAAYDASTNTITDGIATGEFVGVVVDDKLADIVAGLDAEKATNGNTYVNGSIKEENGVITEFAIDESKLAEKLEAIDNANVADVQINKEGGKYDLEILDKNGNVLASMDAAEFVVDGMLSSVTYDETAHTMTFTWNTDANIEAVVVNLDDIISAYNADNVTIEKGANNTFAAKLADVTDVNVTDEAALLNAGDIKTLAENIAVAKIGDLAGEASGETEDKFIKVEVATAEGEVTAVTVTDNVVALGDAVGMSYDEENSEWVAADGTLAQDGLVKASDVAAEIAADEAVIAAALNELKSEIADVNGKSVEAEGDDYVVATATTNGAVTTISVSASDDTKASLALADSAVQSVNGETGSTITLDAQDIELGAELEKAGTDVTAESTVHDVLQDIYNALDAAAKASYTGVTSTGKTIVATETENGHNIEVNIKTLSDEEKAAGAIQLLQDADADGAIYGALYYSGDDVE